MTKSLSISAEDLLDLYEQAIRKDPTMALCMIIWWTIYDEKSASWARDLLEDAGLMPNPETEADKKCEAGLVIEAEKGKVAKKIEKAQLRLIDRKRESLEKSVRLPPRTKRGATSDYKLALYEWKRINPRPTKEELLAGCVPKPLPDSFNPQVRHQAGEEAVPAAGAPNPGQVSEMQPEAAIMNKKPASPPTQKANEDSAPREDQSEESNELLAAVDAELREAGQLIE